MFRLLLTTGVTRRQHGVGSTDPDRLFVSVGYHKEFIDTSQLPSGYGVDDGAAIHYVDGTLEACVAERAGAGVHRLEQHENGVSVTDLDTKVL